MRKESRPKNNVFHIFFPSIFPRKTLWNSDLWLYYSGMFCSDEPPQLRNRLPQTTKDDRFRNGKVHCGDTPGVVLLAHSVAMRGSRQHLAKPHIIQRQAPTSPATKPSCWPALTPRGDAGSPLTPETTSELPVDAYNGGQTRGNVTHILCVNDVASLKFKPVIGKWEQNKGVVFFWSLRMPLIAADRTERMRRRRKRRRRRRQSGVSWVSHNQIRPFVIVPVQVPPLTERPIALSAI